MKYFKSNSQTRPYSPILLGISQFTIFFKFTNTQFVKFEISSLTLQPSYKVRWSFFELRILYPYSKEVSRICSALVTTINSEFMYFDIKMLFLYFQYPHRILICPSGSFLFWPSLIDNTFFGESLTFFNNFFLKRRKYMIYNLYAVCTTKNIYFHYLMPRKYCWKQITDIITRALGITWLNYF